MNSRKYFIGTDSKEMEKSYELTSEKGRYNILELINEHNTRLSALQSVDTAMSAIMAPALFFLGGGYNYLGVAITAIDVALKIYVRDPRAQHYRDNLALLIQVYSACLKRDGVKITRDPLFIKMMSTIAPCLTREQGRDILTPDYIKTDYASISSEFKAILAQDPHNREIEVIAQPTAKSWLAGWVGVEGSDVDAKRLQAQPDVKKVEVTPPNSWTNNLHLSMIWCTIYGHKPAELEAKPSVDIKSAVSQAKSLALRQLAES